MKKRLTVLALALAILTSLASPALAAKVDASNMPGHEVLSALPETVQRPVRPTTLEQAEGRVGSRMITAKRAQERWDAAAEDLRTRYGMDEAQVLAGMKGYDSGILPPEWTLSQSKQSVFEEILALTDSLVAGKSTDIDKVKAIFDWTSQNLKYDYTAYQYWLWQDAGYALTEEQEKRIDESSDPFYVYANRMAICEGYTELSWLMCTIAGVPAVSISGDCNELGANGIGPHAWNAALADGKWVFFDATWKKWDIEPNYHETSESFAFCDGVFQQSVGWADGKSYSSYWLCPGFECPASVTLPDNCFQVMAESFIGCTTLKSITIPSSVTQIETEAFMGCTGLTSIVIPASVQYAHWRSFKDCSNLTSVTFQGNTEVREGAFDGTPMVENAEEFAIVGGVLVKYKGRSREVAIPAGVTAIAERAFADYFDKNMLQKVVIPEGVTSIGESVFYGFKFLKDVTLPKSLKKIGSGAFYNTPWLKAQGDWPIFAGILLAYQGPDVESVTVPDGVVEIADRAFYYNGSNIRKITFPASLKKIGAWMVNHSYLEDVYFAGTRAQWDAVEIVRNGCTNWVMRDFEGAETATIHCGVTGVYAAAPEKPADVAHPSTQTVTVDGKAVTFECYALKDAAGNLTNYIKLRDLAAILNGSAAQFEVGYDGNVVITTKTAYTPNGSEQSTPYSGDQPYQKPNAKTLVNGQEAALDAIQITYNGGGYTYYKLRDLGQTLGFNVGWGGAGIFVETDKPYDPSN